VSRSATRPPLFVFGIDAADPGFIAEWAREGHLPNLAALMQRGCWGRTGGAELLSEHGVWISLLSGVSRADHGYFYFRQMRPGTYDLVTATGYDLDVTPFWSYVSGTGRRSAIIDAWELAPEGDGFDGVQLCNWATHNNWGREYYPTSSSPQELLERLSREIAPKLVAIEDADATVEQDRRMHARLLEQTHAKGRACRMVLESGEFDLVACAFSASHAANHQFWKYRRGLPDRTDDPVLENAIRDVYAAIDHELGEILACLPAGANTAVVSSVGMEDDYPTTGVTEAFFRRLGYQAAPTAGSVSLRPLDFVRRLVPEKLRVLASSGLSRARREALLADGFRSGTDWSRTRAFALPASYTSFVRVNLRGREPQGIVEPGREYTDLLAELESDFHALVDAASGEPAVVRTVRTVDAFGCEPHASLPDLFVDWRPGSFLRRVRHPRAELTQDRPDFYRRSDHGSHGFFALAGPDIAARGEIAEPLDVLAVAPTFMTLLALDVPAVMKGEPATQLLTARGPSVPPRTMGA
jgi:predicted AlkP superfamily phosphohydrolase/phosphomutase